MSTQEQGQGIAFSSDCFGTTLDVKFRLSFLRKLLEDESFQFQRKNIETLIINYECGGKIPPLGQTILLLDGEVVDKMPEKVPEGSALWAEAAYGPVTSCGSPSTSHSHDSFIDSTDSAAPAPAMMTTPEGLTYLSGYIGAIPDEELKLRCLRESLEDNSVPFHRKNIESLIYYYENGGKAPP